MSAIVGMIFILRRSESNGSAIKVRLAQRNRKRGLQTYRLKTDTASRSIYKTWPLCAWARWFWNDDRLFCSSASHLCKTDRRCSATSSISRRTPSRRAAPCTLRVPRIRNWVKFAVRIVNIRQGNITNAQVTVILVLYQGQPGLFLLLDQFQLFQPFLPQLLEIADVQIVQLLYFGVQLFLHAVRRLYYFLLDDGFHFLLSFGWNENFHRFLVYVRRTYRGRMYAV